MGRRPLQVGDLCICQCSPPPTLIASQSFAGFGNGPSPAAIKSADAPAQLDAGKIYDEQIRFLYEDQPVQDMRYILTLADGTVRGGRTDNEGKTERVVTMQPTAITRAEFLPEPRYRCSCHLFMLGARAPAPENSSLCDDLTGIQTNNTDVGSSYVVHKLPKGESRPMTAGEIEMAKSVFKDAIDYSKVKIHYRGFFAKNADFVITPYGEIYFPYSAYKDDFSNIPKDDSRFKYLFIHEMAHVWQYQLGYAIKTHAILLSVKFGYSGGSGSEYGILRAYRYNLDGEDKGKALSDFNMEQQAELISHYFAATETELNMVYYGFSQEYHDLTLLKQTLASFLSSPKDKNLRPQM
jgi:hypothetical protein